MHDTVASTPVYCVDVIARTDSGLFVCIERLRGAVRGLALPGGKVDAGESMDATAVRELGEETGMVLMLRGVVGTYAAPGRDPRGWYVSTVVHGSARGVPHNEEGKTRVLLLSEEEVRARLSEFVLDHADMLRSHMQHGE